MKLSETTATTSCSLPSISSSVFPPYSYSGRKRTRQSTKTSGTTLSTRSTRNFSKSRDGFSWSSLEISSRPTTKYLTLYRKTFESRFISPNRFFETTLVSGTTRLLSTSTIPLPSLPMISILSSLASVPSSNRLLPVKLPSIGFHTILRTVYLSSTVCATLFRRSGYKLKYES